MQILYINACVRSTSRTAGLAQHFLQAVQMQHPDCTITELALDAMHLQPLTNSTLAQRDRFSTVPDFTPPLFDLAHQFAQADRIVIAAPFWEMSYPAVLRIYLELVSVCGITFRYDAQGHPIGMCKADKLVYITTRGGIASGELAFLEHALPHLRTLCMLYGIGNMQEIVAEGLDIWGNDVPTLLAQAQQVATEIAGTF